MTEQKTLGSRSRLQAWYRRLGRAWSRYGAWRLFLVSITSIPRFYRNHRDVSAREKKQRDFDKRFGVNTAGITDLSAFSIKHANWVWGARYGPSSEEFVVSLLRKLELDYRCYTFVDYGSGKGAVLLYATRFPFLEIIGIEFSRELHDMALDNIRHFRDRGLCNTPIRSICADVTTFQLPLTPLVLYFWNPFGPPVLKNALANIESSLRLKPRPIYLIYAYPSDIWSSDSILNGQSFLSKMEEGNLEGIPHVIYQAAPSLPELNRHVSCLP
jgi:Histone methylation protein DOT1